MVPLLYILDFAFKACNAAWIIPSFGNRYIFINLGNDLFTNFQWLHTDRI